MRAETKRKRKYCSNHAQHVLQLLPQIAPPLLTHVVVSVWVVACVLLQLLPLPRQQLSYSPGANSALFIFVSIDTKCLAGNPGEEGCPLCLRARLRLPQGIDGYPCAHAASAYGGVRGEPH